MICKFMARGGIEERDCPVVVIDEDVLLQIGSLARYLGTLFGDLIAIGDNGRFVDYIKICKLTDIWAD